MPYTPTTWNPGIAPGISAANLNNLETQYDQAIADSGITVIVKDADESVDTSIVMQNDDELLLPLAVNTDYSFMLILEIISASATPGLDHTFTVPAGATGGFRHTLALSPRPQTGFATEDTVAAVDLTPGVELIVFGTIQVAATPGNLQFQWAQATSDGNATVVKAGSTLILFS